MKITIHIIASHSLRVFKNCIESVCACAPEDAWIYVFLNGPQPEKMAWLKSCDFSRVIAVEKDVQPVSRLRNLAFQNSVGDLIYFLDDDVIVSPGVFEHAATQFSQNPKLDILGGPNLTPPGSSYLERLFGAVLTSSFAAPFVFARYSVVPGLDGKRVNDLRLILCNLIVRRSSIPDTLRFSEELWPNEENLFLHEAEKLGLWIEYCSKLFVFHHRRSSLGHFLKQIRRYGDGRAKQMALSWRSTPLVFPALLLFAGLFFFSHPKLFVVTYLLGSTVGWVSSREARGVGWTSIFFAPFLTLLLHLSYLYGLSYRLLVSLFSSLFLRISKYNVLVSSPGR